MRAPQNEQELFYLYGVLSTRYLLPVRVLEYSTSRGVDSIALLRPSSGLLPGNDRSHVRVEFKYDVRANNPIDHFFSSIDLIICWKVELIGAIYEKASYGVPGTLRKRKSPVLTGGLDSHEIAVVHADGSERVIPVLALSTLFKPPATRKRR